MTEPTPEQIERIRVLCAQEVGWMKVTIPAHEESTFIGIEVMPEITEWVRDNITRFMPPNYPGDLNASAELRALLTDEEQMFYVLELRKIQKDAGKIYVFDLIDATALQTCIAFLATRGVKWE
jgi:hypothetical protein